MRLLPLFLAASVSTSVALAQPNQTPSTVANPPVVAQPAIQVLPLIPLPRPGTAKEQIDADLKSIFAALNSETVSAPTDYFSISQFISGGRIGYFGLSEWKDYFVGARGKSQYRIDRVEVEKIENDAARVKVSYSQLVPNNVALIEGQPLEPAIRVVNQEETLDLKLEIVPWNKIQTWRIVPPTFDTLQRYRPLSLGHIAYFASQREGTLPQLRAEISANRLKQVGLGTIIFTQDYDEQLAFQNDFWRDAIKPYVKSESIYLIPGTQTPYTFNDNLSAKNLAEVKQPDQTVLFYEGENERPIFRYNGQAAICFADGHVKLVSPEAAKSLLWKP